MAMAKTKKKGAAKKAAPKKAARKAAPAKAAAAAKKKAAFPSMKMKNKSVELLSKLAGEMNGKMKNVQKPKLKKGAALPLPPSVKAKKAGAKKK